MANFMRLGNRAIEAHGDRVAELTAGILSKVRRTPPQAHLIVWAARVHDIGKVGIPDSVLSQTEPLSPSERAQVEAHASIGAEMLADYGHPQQVVEMVRHHHERWDGRGYPSRLHGLEIPFGSRVIAVADSFDSMLNERPYRQAMSVLQAAQVLREGRGREWDPTIVDAFLESIRQRLNLAERLLQTDPTQVRDVLPLAVGA
jgi:putative nucleotidyltransferase with HDIG domain